MPDGTRLKRAKLRGVQSNGMILAEDELAIGLDHDGIMVLDDELTPGTPLADVLPIATDVLELAITSNRPDCLSIYGAAREVHAATGAPLNPPPWLDDPGHARADRGRRRSRSRRPDLCPRFTARLFEDVTIGPSPAWLKARLMASGQRPINNVVDITNYVMLLTGQPLHAFDWDLVAGGQLVVRWAGDGEKMTTLDDAERTLDSDMGLICDDDGPTSIAGVMGGQRSEVQPTHDAGADGGGQLERPEPAPHVAAAEPAHRGLRALREGPRARDHDVGPGGLDPADARADRRAAGADGTVDVGGEGPPPKTIRLRDEKVSGLLGAEVPLGEQAELLERLDFGVVDTGDGLDVTVPPVRRNDVTREVDLIEEVARLWGLDKLPSTLPAHGASGRLTVEQKLRRRAGDALVGAGFSEAIGWSFEAPEMARKLRVVAPAVKLRNPLCEDLSVMRTTLLGSLLTAVRHNVARGREDVRLFEEGSVYFDRPHGRELTAAEARSTPLPDERMHLGRAGDRAAAPGLVGRARRRRAPTSSPPRRALETLLGALRVDWSVVRGDDAFLHPGRAARVLVAGEDAGWLGEVHPGVASEWDLGRVAGFELDLGAVLPHADYVPAYEDLTSFPAIRQDLAFWVPADRTAAELVEVVRGAGGKLLRDVQRVRRLRARGADLAGGAAGVPRERPHADRRGDRAAAQEDRGGGQVQARGRAPWLRSPSSAPSATPARSPRSCSTATRSSSSRTSPRGRRPASGWTTSTRARACRWSSRSSTCARHAVDAAVVAYPHGAAAPVVAELRAAGTRVVDLSADFRLRDRAIYDDWYGEHKAPAIFGQGVYGLPELTREAVRGRRSGRQPGLLPDRRAARAGAAGAGGRDRRRGHRRQVGRVAAPAARRRTRRTSSPPTRTSRPTRSPGTATRRRSSRSCGVLGADLPITFMPHLLPLDQGELVSCYVTPSAELSEDELVNLFDDMYAREPFVELRTGPVGVIDVRDTNYCRISWHQDPRTGRIIVFSAIDNLWKGAASQAVQNLNLMFDRPETEGLL